MKKNLAITGAKGAGKSTLAGKILEQWDRPYGGFRTLRYAVTEAGPLYALQEIVTGEQQPISRLTEEGIRGIPETFEGFGVQVLERTLASGVELVLLDEIGRFERDCPLFLQKLTQVLDSPSRAIAVLKKEALPHIDQIKARRDTLLIDLDEDPM